MTDKLTKMFEEAAKTPEYELESLLVDIGEELSSVLENIPFPDILSKTKEEKQILKGKILPLDAYVNVFHKLGYRLKFTIEKL